MTHRRSAWFPLARAQLFECLLENQVEEHVVPTQDTRHCTVGLDVHVDTAVHVLEMREADQCEDAVSRSAESAPFSVLAERFGTWWTG